MMQFLANALIAASIYTLVGLGFSFVYSVVRFLHFAHGVIYTAAAYFFYMLTIYAGQSQWLSILLAVFGAASLGAIMEIAVYRRLRRNRTSPLVFLVASIGLYIALQNLISLIFGDEVLTLRVDEARESFEILGAYVTFNQIIIILVGSALSILLWLFLQWSRVGRAMRAIANDPELSQVVGVNVDRVILLVFFLGSALAAVAGILISYETDLTPTMGFNVLLMGIVAAFVGGMGSMTGVALGAMLIGLARELSAFILPIGWQDSIVFLILVLFLLLRPQGFLGKPSRKAAI